MILKLLGTAAGGGFPQWNCACPNCSLVRKSGLEAGRLHASLAVSARGDNWYLFDATPDIRLQIESTPSLHPGPGVRQTPIKGIFLTDAELDHTVGLLSLRERSTLEVFSTAAVAACLTERFPVRTILADYAQLDWRQVEYGREVLIDNAEVAVCAFPLGNKRPRYAGDVQESDGWVTGYRVTSRRTGRSAVYAPSIDNFSDDLAQALGDADLAFVDGTFWSADEVMRLGVSERTAQEMGHMPLGGRGALLDSLAGSGAGRKILVHINNTNPILMAESTEAGELAALGVEVGADGIEYDI